MAKKNIIVLTGVPGTGKTKTASVLAESGFAVVDLNLLAKSCGLFGDFDSQDQSHEVNLKALEKVLRAILPILESRNVVVEGHLGCEIKVRGAIAVVLRCNPDVIGQRLLPRGYAKAKIAKNAMAEMLDYCTIQSQKNYGKVFEFDTTSSTPEEISIKIMRTLEGKKVKKQEKIDWSKKLLDVDVRTLVEA